MAWNWWSLRAMCYAGIKISTSWGYLAVVLGCGLMILRTLVSIKRSALTLINGKLPADTKAGKGGIKHGCSHCPV